MNFGTVGADDVAEDLADAGRAGKDTTGDGDFQPDASGPEAAQDDLRNACQFGSGEVRISLASRSLASAAASTTGNNSAKPENS